MAARVLEARPVVEQVLTDLAQRVVASRGGGAPITLRVTARLAERA